MAFEYGFYNSIDGDRTYDADQFGDMFDGLIRDGVYATIGEAFMVTPGPEFSVVVGTGRAWFNKTWSVNRTRMQLNLEYADLLLPRIDAVVLEVNKNTFVRANSIKIVTGTPSANPVRPASTGESNVYWYPLAYINVSQNAEKIEAKDITVVVGQSPTNFVTAMLDTVDITTMYQHWEQQFSDWFEDIHSQLSGDIATNLLGMIQRLDADTVKKSEKATKDDILGGTDDSKWVTPAGIKMFNDGQKGLPYSISRFDKDPGEGWVRCRNSEIVGTHHKLSENLPTQEEVKLGFRFGPKNSYIYNAFEPGISINDANAAGNAGLNDVYRIAMSPSLAIMAGNLKHSNGFYAKASSGSLFNITLNSKTLQFYRGAVGVIDSKDVVVHGVTSTNLCYGDVMVTQDKIAYGVYTQNQNVVIVKCDLGSTSSSILTASNALTTAHTNSIGFILGDFYYGSKVQYPTNASQIYCVSLTAGVEVPNMVTEDVVTFFTRKNLNDVTKKEWIVTNENKSCAAYISYGKNTSQAGVVALKLVDGVPKVFVHTIYLYDGSTIPITDINKLCLNVIEPVDGCVCVTVAASYSLLIRSMFMTDTATSPSNPEYIDAYSGESRLVGRETIYFGGGTDFSTDNIVLYTMYRAPVLIPLYSHASFIGEGGASYGFNRAVQIDASDLPFGSLITMFYYTQAGGTIISNSGKYQLAANQLYTNRIYNKSGDVTGSVKIPKSLKIYPGNTPYIGGQGDYYIKI